MSRSDSPAAAGFEPFQLHPNLLRGVRELGFTEPRPIQRQTLPAALAGRDVLGLAQTGTGKTAAFALPILQRLLERPGAGPRALVVAPTRELALQIQAEFQALARFTNVRVVTVFGGVGQGPQATALRKRPEVVVACPGRLLDLLQQGLVRLDAVEVLVLDEADHMFDMGFLPDIRRILSALPARRQNLLFSATMPAEIRGLADRVLRQPHTAELANSAPAATIEHALLPIADAHKPELLRAILREPAFRSAIVFLRTKHRARRLAQQLERDGHRAVALQGNMSQGQRERAMAGFRSGQYDVLVATDIAARGLDIAGVSHVVNFDVPNTPDAYTHRIGRTGRAERSGKAFTFVTREDADAVRAIEKRIGTPIPRLVWPGFSADLAPPSRTTAAASLAARRGAAGRSPARPQRGRTGSNGSAGTARGRAQARPAKDTRPAKEARPAKESRPHAVSVGSNSAFGAGLDPVASPKRGRSR